MSEFRESPLFARAYDLVRESCIQSERLPRARRAVLGRRMEEAAFEFHEALMGHGDPDDFDVMSVRDSLGEVLTALGKLKPARTLLTAALATMERIHGPMHWQTAQVAFDVGKLEFTERHMAQAEVELQEEPPTAISRLERRRAFRAAHATSGALVPIHSVTSSKGVLNAASPRTADGSRYPRYCQRLRA